MRRLALSVIGAALLTLGGSTASAYAEVHIPASMVAEVVIAEDPGTCHEILHALNIVGYETAEEAFAITYNSHNPNAAQAFHALVTACRRR
jgi:hypothetical protein